ncbi:TATA-box binding family protein [Methanohalobium evestigatum Z-7303]|uniref:TATA-box binding family protein n=1 Tax=Methanohalobium evestigatum (strain ATCC BAA-1072 / DSM 3721 / NBRC 107634 / OCM 161 / Z-7303) TaxID=644295 RepID=D7E839_METEZ|nr:TATA-box-binding family protein [Methanohalobium evestigatum]ADI73381.1 TATA-box binding family protein [Methanohalobium evestigatum Z-7303]
MEIVNVVATVKLNSYLDLASLEDALQDTQVVSTSKVWLKMRLMPENYYVAFYKSGKFLITGVKSTEDISTISNRVLDILKNAGIDVDIEDTYIQNIVAVDKIEMNSTLEKIIYNLDPSKSSYEPEQFPGLIYKNWGASFLLFSSGKVVITGVKDENYLDDLITKFKNEISFE